MKPFPERPPPPVPASASLSALKPAADACRACAIGERATQAVVGRGPRGARLMLVGEQPGHEEDLAGAPFVGPSGRLLKALLGEAGLGEEELYVTNAVKHFKWVPFGRSGKRRLHQKPAAAEVAACRPWLEKELSLVRPEVIVCLGATAVRAVLGRALTLKSLAGREREREGALVLATFHPSAALRAPGEARRKIEADLRATLKRAKQLLEEGSRKRAA